MSNKIDQCKIDKEESDKAFEILTSEGFHSISLHDLLDYKRKLVKHIPANKYEIYTKQNMNLISLIDTKIEVLKLEQNCVQRYLQPTILEILKFSVVALLGFVLGQYSSGKVDNQNESQVKTQQQKQ